MSHLVNFSFIKRFLKPRKFKKNIRNYLYLIKIFEDYFLNNIVFMREYYVIFLQYY